MKTKAGKILLILCMMFASFASFFGTDSLKTLAKDDNVFKSSPDYKNDKKTLLLQSFEDEKDGLLTNEVDPTKGVSNVVNAPDKGVITSTVIGDSIKGSADFNSNETKVRLFDQDTNTKFLTNEHKPSESQPVTVEFQTEKVKPISTYNVASANDSDGRDPKNWELFGSTDGKTWVSLDKRENQRFTERKQTKSFELNLTEAYGYYKFDITANHGNDGMTQFSNLTFFTNDLDVSPDGMVTRRSNGPISTWNQKAGAGWTGAKALEVSGAHRGHDGAHAYNTLYKDVNIAVDENTYLSYTMFPYLLDDSNYDYEFTDMHMMIDLKFSDGSYLSDLGALDQNDVAMTPQAQGDSRILTMHQWNQVTTKLGKVANGKTISEILIGYDKKDNLKEEDLAEFLTYFDDIEVYTKSETDYANVSDYVNILRGTNGNGNFSRGLTVPAVTMPHGANFWAPATTTGDTIYEYQTRELNHMTVSHEPSIWTSDRGTWQYMSNTSINAADVTSKNQINVDARRSAFSHDNEIGHAHYYSVKFDDKTPAANSKVETTPTEHAAVVRYTFDNDAKNQSVILDCIRGASQFEFINGNSAFQTYSDHASNGSKRMYVYGEFNKTPTAVKNFDGSGAAIATFGEGKGTVEMKVATSYISYEQAKRNLSNEVESSDTFNDVFSKAQKVWDEKIGIVEVEGASEDEKVTLYSNLYRLFMYPNNLSENTGTNDDPVWKYASPYGGTVQNPIIKEGKMYINNGFWDTYKNTWAAYGLLTPSMNTEMLNGLVAHYNDQGWVPRWIAPGGTNSMVGTSSDVVFGDAMNKGYEFDHENAYKSAIRNAATVSDNLVNGGRAGLEESIFRGYTANNVGEGFSWSMEGYINDYGIYQMAKKLGYVDEAQYYLNRAQNYTLLYDNADGNIANKFFKGRTTSGDWSNENFNPHWYGGDYTETNAFNMSAHVMQDGQGLANLYGGREELGKKLDETFTDTGNYYGYGAVESVGGIHEQKEAREIKLGQYGHSNQPSHHIPYMYNYAGEAYKTQYYTRDIMERIYRGSSFGQGYIGDEDNGEMSGWYIFSAMGLYPVSMGNDEFAIGSPLFDKMTVHLENGKDLTIIANNNSDENVYVQSLKVNGENSTRSYIKTSEVQNGGTLEFTMGSEPNKEFGSKEEDLPTSITKGDEVATPDQDVTQANVAVAKDAPKGEFVVADTIYSKSDVKNLFDNTSKTVVPLEDKTTLYYSGAQRSLVNMITLTSGAADKAPTGFVLSGSNDGENWTKLESRKDLTFEWKKYTRPFKVSDTGTYVHYKLELTGGSELAEVELIGERLDGDVSKAMLQAVYNEVAKIDQTDMNKVFVNIINEALGNAKTVLDNENATGEEISAQYLNLIDLLNKINTSKDVYEPIAPQSYVADGGVANDPDGVVGGVKNGTYVAYDLAFHGTIDKIMFNHSVQNDSGGTVSFRIDSKTAEPFAEFTVEGTGSWGNFVNKEVDIDDVKIEGYHRLFITFKAKEGSSHVSNIKGITIMQAKGDKTSLNDLIEEVKDYDGSKYTEESFGNFETALNEAKEVTSNVDATQKEVDDATTALQTAVDNLVEVEESNVNKDTLTATIASAEALKEANYTTETWKAVSDALTSAKAVLANADATQEEVDAANTALQTAIDNLVEVEESNVNKDALTATVASAETLKAADYTAETWKAVSDALTSAKSVLANADATQDEVNAAKAALETAVANLKGAVVSVDKTELQTSITNAEALKEVDYTPETWKGVVEALANAKAVMANEEATQEEVDVAKTKLVDAISKLSKVSEKPNVEAPSIAPGDNNKPSTGTNTSDTTNTSVFLMMLLLSTVGIGFGVSKKKRKLNK
ncbi:hypothetical protein A4S06_01175 [Erysipelotrichaceae bacterium MTC7]|nr:hypothetical protein A4S06_01175 [Erysipelotrichaceae bacterium MTC7]